MQNMKSRMGEATVYATQHSTRTPVPQLAPNQFSFAKPSRPAASDVEGANADWGEAGSGSADDHDEAPPVGARARFDNSHN